MMFLLFFRFVKSGANFSFLFCIKKPFLNLFYKNDDFVDLTSLKINTLYEWSIKLFAKLIFFKKYCTQTISEKM